MSQLALPLTLADHAIFGSYLDAGNEAVVSLLKTIADGDADAGCWLWGPPSSGKTHLLQAVCERAGDRSVYLPMRVIAEAGPGIVEGLEHRSVICIDDIESVAGQADWERGLFNLYNAVLASSGRIVVAASMAQRECPIALADLASRLSQLPGFRLQELDDADRVAALQLRATHRGLELPDETARYLLNRSRRDMASLYGILDTLDREALRAQRRLTVPFVGEVLRDRAER